MGVRPVIGPAMATAFVCLAVVGIGVPAHADTIDVIDRLGCGQGLTVIAAPSGPGASVPATWTSVVDRPTSTLDTSATGSPPVQLAATADTPAGLYRFSPHADDAGLDPRFGLGTVAVKRTDPGDRTLLMFTLPAAQRVFFTAADVNWEAERATLVGFRAGVPVSPTIIPRSAPGDVSVLSAVNPDGSASLWGASVGADTFDSQVSADVVFDRPVDQVRIVQDNPTDVTGFTYAEYTAFLGCQGVDVTLTAGAPQLIAANGDGWTYDVPLTVRMGSTATPADAALYGAAAHLDLRPLTVGGGVLVDVGSLSESGHCAVAPGYDGVTELDLLSAVQPLVGGQSCSVSLRARVRIPAFTAPAVRTLMATATTAGLAADSSSDSAELPATVHGDQPRATRVVFEAPVVTPSPTSSPTAAPPTDVAPPTGVAGGGNLGGGELGLGSNSGPVSDSMSDARLPATGFVRPVAAGAFGGIAAGAAVLLVARRLRRAARDRGSWA